MDAIAYDFGRWQTIDRGEPLRWHASRRMKLRDAPRSSAVFPLPLRAMGSKLRLKEIPATSRYITELGHLHTIDGGY